MPGPDVTNQSNRSMIIDSIESEENYSRKRAMQRRFDVYRDRQDRYIIEKLEKEFGAQSACDMRKILSINLSKRIVDEKSSIYRGEPVRNFANASEREQEQLENLYRTSKVDSAMLLTNKYYNLFDQTALQIIPRDGKMSIRPLGPHQYDVIPDSLNPEKAFAYVMNVWDFDLHKSFADPQGDYRYNDRANQVIADDNDRLASKGQYVWWTEEWHFVTNERGQLLTEIMPNPIGMLPFIDVATEKDFQFFVRRGSAIVEFSLEWAVCMSDLANINRLQGYAQGVVTSEKEPKGIKVGPQHLIWLKLDKNAPELTPTFQFITPSPDLAGGLSILETKLRAFLAAENVDTSAISTGGEQRSFSSGMDRLIALLDKFEATRQDMALFDEVEDQMLVILSAWSNAFQGVGEGRLVDDLNVSTLNDKIKLDVKFHEPTAVQSDAEKLGNIEKRMDLGIMTEVEAVMVDRDVTEEVAEEILTKVKERTEIEKPEVTPFEGDESGREVREGDREDSPRREDEAEGKTK